MKRLLITTLLTALSVTAFADNDDCHYLNEYHSWEGTSPTYVGQCAYTSTVVHSYPGRGYMLYSLSKGQGNTNCRDITDKVHIEAKTCHPDGASDDFNGSQGEKGSIYKNDHSLSLTSIQGYFEIISAKMIA
jgi:hypothetical protein